MGDVGVIGHTENGGEYWATLNNPDAQNRSLYAVFFLDSDNGWAVGAEGIVLNTDNGGTNWTIVANGLTTAFLLGVQFTSLTNGYVVGNGKTLLRYGELTGVKKGILMSEIISYPNPFSNGVITEYELNQPEKTSLKIFNHMGKIAYQTQENLTQGKHQLIWDAEGIPDGIYYYRLQTGIEMALGKLMKVE